MRTLVTAMSMLLAVSALAFAVPVDPEGNPREPEYSSWVMAGQAHRYAFTDLYHMNDRDDVDEVPRWMGTLSMVCVDRDHLEYRVSTDITDLTVGEDYPNPDAPRPITIANIRKGFISAADSVKIAGFFLKYISILDKLGAEAYEYYYVDLTVGGKPAYVTLKGFADARNEMRATCFGPQPVAAGSAQSVAPAGGLDVVSASALLTGTSTGQLPSELRAAFSSDGRTATAGLTMRGGRFTYRTEKLAECKFGLDAKVQDPNGKLMVHVYKEFDLRRVKTFATNGYGFVLETDLDEAICETPYVLNSKTGNSVRICVRRHQVVIPGAKYLGRFLAMHMVSTAMTRMHCPYSG